jgi:hypothetical protein
MLLLLLDDDAGSLGKIEAFAKKISKSSLFCMMSVVLLDLEG